MLERNPSMLPGIRHTTQRPPSYLSRILLALGALIAVLTLFKSTPPSFDRISPQSDEAAQSQIAQLISKVDHLSAMLATVQAPTDVDAESESSQAQTHGSPRAVTSSRPAEQRHQPSLQIRPVHRESDLSAAEFSQMAGNAFVQAPMVIEDAMRFSYEASDWTREGLARHCGERSMRHDECDDDEEDCHSVREIDAKLVGHTWAGLKTTNLTAAGIETLADFLRAQEANPAMYVHDAPIARQCPALFSLFKAPKYFPTDLKELQTDVLTPTALGFMYHPSLFIGKAGSGSPLHSDADMTRFWLLVMNGSKRVRMMPPSENWRGTSADQRFQPLVYSIDLMAPDFVRHPNMDGLLVYETTLKAGELLFIPAGWAHQVTNLEDIVATSQNFVDSDSVAMHLRAKYEQLNDLDEDDDPYVAYHEFLDLQERMTAFYLPLVDSDADGDNVDWHAFMRGQILEHAPLPASAIRFVNIHRLAPKPDDSDAPSDSSSDSPPGAPVGHAPGAKPGAPGQRAGPGGGSADSVPNAGLQGSAPGALPPGADHPDTWRDAFGRSPLHVATRHNFVAVVKHLIEEGGVHRDLLDERGFSPLALANDRKLYTLARYLKSLGARVIRPSHKGPPRPLKPAA